MEATIRVWGGVECFSYIKGPSSLTTHDSHSLLSGCFLEVRQTMAQNEGSTRHANGSIVVSETVGMHRTKAYESPFKRNKTTSSSTQEAVHVLRSSSRSHANEAQENLPTQEEEQTNHERRLLEYLMRNYDNTIRPVRDAASPVVIKLGITLTQIVDLVSKRRREREKWEKASCESGITCRQEICDSD